MGSTEQQGRSAEGRQTLARGVLSLLLFAAAGTIVAGPLAASDPCPGKAPCDLSVKWLKASRSFALRADGTAGDFAEWKGHFNADGTEARIDCKRSNQGNRQEGSILLVAGLGMAVHGLSASPGSEIDILDEPLLRWRLALSILGLVVPDGPETVTKRREIHQRETKNPIEVSTPSAFADYPPPFTVDGWVARRSQTEVDFDVTLKTARTTLHLSGSLSNENSPAPLVEQMSLAGWQTYVLGPVSQTQGGTTTMDYAATPVAKRAATVGAFRAFLKADHDHPRAGKP
jgi:hypothetical protein